MCIKDPINKTCLKNGKDLSNGAPNIKLWNHTKKTHFPVFAKNFRKPCMKLKIFFCQFPNPWTLRVSGMGGYTSKCEKSQNHWTLKLISYPSSRALGSVDRRFESSVRENDSISFLLWLINNNHQLHAKPHASYALWSKTLFCDVINHVL